MVPPILDFDSLAQDIARCTVLCIGDIMLDEFVYGEVSRISPEAPTPVIAAQRSEIHIGGAGNVARNIASLGARPNIDYVDMPEQIRGSYQYFTESKVDRLHRAGYNGGFTTLEDAVKAYVGDYLDRPDRFR